MTDNFEKAMQNIAIKGGEPTPRDILTALQATNEDLDVQHDQTETWHQGVTSLLTAHLDEAKERDRRITNLELAEKDRRTKCVPLMEKIAREEHTARHTAYVSTLGDSTFQSRLVWFFASATGKVFLVVSGLAAGMLLNLIVYGRP